MIKDALYYSRPAVTKFRAEVLHCEKSEKPGCPYRIILSENGFYPEGGGQDCDLGTIGEAKLLYAGEEQGAAGVVYLYVDRELPVGESFDCEVDGFRRRILTENHSGEHLLSGLVHQKYGYENVGFHMQLFQEEPMVTIDFDGPLTEAECRELESEVNRLIRENRPFLCEYPSPEEREKLEYRSKKALSGEVRIVTVPGVDRCACCGTQVQSSGEIGLMKIFSVASHRSGVRLTLLFGELAFRDYREMRDIVKHAAVSFSVKDRELPAALLREQQEKRRLEDRIRRLQDRYFATLLPKAEAALGRDGFYLSREEECSRGELRRLGEYLKAKLSLPLGLFLCPEGAGKDAYLLISAEDRNLRPLGQRFNAAFSGRGGGQKNFLQGSIRTTDLSEIRCFLSENCKSFSTLPS